MKPVIKPEEDNTKSPAKDRDATGAGIAFGTAGGAIMGGVAGSLAGPAGTVIGALAGAAAGAAVGKVVGAGGWAENEDYWRDNYRSQPFYKAEYDYGDYEGAFRLGHERPPLSRVWDEAHEAELAGEWERNKGKSRLTWEEARLAARAAWERLENDQLR
jgi:hypothetical protein